MTYLVNQHQTLMIALCHSVILPLSYSDVIIAEWQNDTMALESSEKDASSHHIQVSYYQTIRSHFNFE